MSKDTHQPVQGFGRQTIIFLIRLHGSQADLNLLWVDMCIMFTKKTSSNSPVYMLKCFILTADHHNISFVIYYRSLNPHPTGLG